MIVQFIDCLNSSSVWLSNTAVTGIPKIKCFSLLSCILERFCNKALLVAVEEQKYAHGFQVQNLFFLCQKNIMEVKSV